MNLVIAAHPDDEVLGCGGTIARLAGEGQDVHILILGEGATSRYAQRTEAPAADLRRLREQAHKAAALLGAKGVTVHGLPDNRFDTVPLLDIVKAIETHVNRLQPETMFVQHGGDLNIDHALTFRAALTAARPMAGAPVKRVYAYEVPSSTEWSFGQFAPAFRPNTFVDIGATFRRKQEAMALYEEEARAFPHPRSPEALEAHARYWGSAAGLEAAEAFQLIRETR
ncbi:MAG: PIG-L family deacetylase [Patescibacteria group bacterium]